MQFLFLWREKSVDVWIIEMSLLPADPVVIGYVISFAYVPTHIQGC